MGMIRDLFAGKKQEPATLLAAPVARPERVTLYAMRETIRADMRALSGNPIAREVLARYWDLLMNVDETGEPVSQIEPANMFRDRVNELTVGHLNQVRRKRARELGRQVKKQQEKAMKETQQRRYSQSQRKQKNVQPRPSA